MYTEEEKIKVAYALNLWTVSISQIVDYDDTYVLEQEYNTIMNNLNLEKMPKDDALKEIIHEILDEIKNLQMNDGDRRIVEWEYQHRVKTAIWDSVPNVGAIFATAEPTAMLATLASQVGIGYMNYRRSKAEHKLGYEKSKWQIQRNRMQHLHGLQRQLFDTAWELYKKYNPKDEYRLTETQISAYNRALMEPNSFKRYNRLNEMRSWFEAYPVFWYQIGSTANSIYRSEVYAEDADVREIFKESAVECFEKYHSLNKFNLLRHDVLTSAWALEYLELQDLDCAEGLAKAKELIEIAKKYSGDASDVLELCAFAYLRVADYDSATEVFHSLVNKGYNSSINTQILSGLYIKTMRSDEAKAANARVKYKLLSQITDQKYILEIPEAHVDLTQWKPEWNREESFEELLERTKDEHQQEKEKREESRKKAQVFYQRPLKLVYEKKYEEIAEFFLGVLTENRNKISDRLPVPSRCEMKEYEKNREDLERTGTHIIMIGDSAEAKKLYKNAKNGRWDYYHLGMRYISYGNKTVLLTRKVKNDQIDDLVLLGKELSGKHVMNVPSNLESVKSTFLKDCYERATENGPVVTGLATVVGWPLLVIGQSIENIENGIQLGRNLAGGKKLEFLQYCIAIYKYLDSEAAIVD